MFACVLSNAHTAHEYLVNGSTGCLREHKGDFLREMERGIILGKEPRQKKLETEGQSASLAAGMKRPETEDKKSIGALHVG